MMQDDLTKKTRSGLSGVKIAVDLTPMLPGGENGGAKLMTLGLINALANLLRETTFVLLTAESSHVELDWMEKKHSNIQRMCVLHNIPQTNPSMSVPSSSFSWRNKTFNKSKAIAVRIVRPELKQRITALSLSISHWRSRTFERLIAFAKYILPGNLRQRISYWLDGTKPETDLESVLRQIGANLLFCPFTAPFYADPLIPTVSVIYDLQYRAYPQFFTSEELIQRENNFRMAYQNASYLVTISEFVRQTVIEAANLSPKRVIAVPIGLLHAPRQLDKETSGNGLLEKHSLRRSEYILYPANFWEHKNHAMLLTAFSMYRRANPGSMLKLLCTGTPGLRAEAFCEAARRMGWADWVIYPGYVTSDEYDFLLRSAFAMIFPSLYEGFGIPVLEAMSAGVPVLCSNVTSLPEVGGDAVLYFDPRQPSQIVIALTRLSEEPGLRESRIAKGLQRALLFEGVDRMSRKYVDVFAMALLPRVNGDSSQGVNLPTENSVDT